MNAAKLSAQESQGLRALLAEVMVRNTRSAVDVRLPHRVAASVVVAPSAAEAGFMSASLTFVAERYKPGEHAGRYDSRLAAAAGWQRPQGR